MGGMASGGMGGMASGGMGGAGGAAPTVCEAITDGSFENGLPTTAWTHSSLEYDSPICDGDSCNNGTNWAHDGEWWAWFGGLAGYDEAMVAQDVVIPESATSLTFYLNVAACDDGT